MNCMFSLLSSSRQSVRPNCQVINYSECRPRNSLSSSYAPELSRSSSQFTLRLCFVSYHLIPLVKLIGVDGRNFSGPFHFRFRSVSKNLDRIDFKIGNQLNTIHMSLNIYFTAFSPSYLSPSYHRWIGDKRSKSRS